MNITYLLYGLCLLCCLSCKSSEKSTEVVPDSKISVGMNRIYAQILNINLVKPQSAEDSPQISDATLKVLRVQGSGGSVKSVAKDQKITVYLSPSFQEVYAKNGVRINDYFAPDKKITLTIKPKSDDADLWQVVELHY